MNTPACAAIPPDDFTIHGLWPEMNSGPSLLNCDPTSQSLKDDMLEDLRADLLTEWPSLYANNWEENKGFWKHEWIKHGTCSEAAFLAKDYLRTAIALRKKLDVLHALSSSGIVPDSNKLYNPDDIRNAIDQSTKVNPDIQCKKGKGGRWYLVQVYLCVDKKGVQFKSCSGRLRGCTDAKGKFVSVTFPSVTYKLIALNNNITTFDDDLPA